MTRNILTTMTNVNCVLSGFLIYLWLFWHQNAHQKGYHYATNKGGWHQETTTEPYGKILTLWEKAHSSKYFLKFKVQLVAQIILFQNNGSQ